MYLLGASWDARTEARRTRRRRERQLYRRLLRAGVNLPPFTPGSRGFTAAQHVALFQELERRGAFDIWYFEFAFQNWSATVSRVQLWLALREEGFVYQPKTMGYRGCRSSGWHLGVERVAHLRSADGNEYQG